MLSTALLAKGTMLHWGVVPVQWIPRKNNPYAKPDQSGAVESDSHEEIRYGEGKVLAYEIIGTVGKLNLVGVRLEVLPPQSEAFEITEQWVIPGDAQSYLQIGIRIPVGGSR